MASESIFQEELQKLSLIAELNKTASAIKLSDFRETMILLCVLINITYRTKMFSVTPTAKRGMMIAPFLMAVAQFSGTFTLISYAATIFSETGSTINPDTSTIVLGCMQLLGTISASVLIDRLGRKMLLIASTSSSATCLCVISLYTMLKDQGYALNGLNWLPVVTFSLFIFVSAIGILPVPYVIVSEVLPQKVKEFSTSLTRFYINIILLLDSPNWSHNLRLYSQYLRFCDVVAVSLDAGRIWFVCMSVWICLRQFLRVDVYHICCTRDKGQESSSTGSAS